MAASGPWSFLKDSHMQFGVFYPEHYALAAFPDFDKAERAAAAVRSAGFADEDVHVLDGPTMHRRLKDDSEAGLLDRMLATLAEVVGNEPALVERDIAEARRGAGFLFVYSPGDEDGERIRRVLERCGALYAHRYLPVAIERLVPPGRQPH